MLTEGKVAMVAVVGNEDGAHHVVAEVLQALDDTRFSVASSAGASWVGEALGSTDYQDLDATPEKTASTTRTAAARAAALARLLKTAGYPPVTGPEMARRPEPAPA